MTFTIKVRGGGGLLCAEYRCPEHGLFEATVPRGTDGAPPVAMLCPESLFVDGEDCCHDHAGVCDQLSPWTPSAPKIRNLTVLPTALVKGGDTERRPGMLDTRPLAEGMSMKEWKKLQRKGTEERRHHELIAKGLKQKKIQVG